MQSKATTVAAYLAELPADRRAALQAVREVIRKNLDKDYEEGMQYGMIGYFVPHRVYSPGYHCDPKQPLPFVCLASQKNYMSLYMGCVYICREETEWFHAAWAKTGKKLDMGKSCIRFKRLEDLPLEVVGEAIRRMPAKRLIGLYEAVRQREPQPRPKNPQKSAARKSVVKRKPAAKKKSATRRSKAR